MRFLEVEKAPSTCDVVAFRLATPLSYFVSAILSEVTCASNEFTAFCPPSGQTCGDYMTDYISKVGGYLLDPNSTSDCKYSKIKDTNVYLAAIGSEYSNRWRNFGIMWVYITFNVVAALVLYWIVKIPKGRRKKL